VTATFFGLPGLCNTYLDPPTFLAYTSGMDLTGLTGTSNQLAADAALGSNALTLVDTTGFVEGMAVIYDGANSEQVIIIATSPTTLGLGAPLSAAHGAGRTISQPTIENGIADYGIVQATLDGSAWVDNYTQRCLNLTVYGNERYRLIQDKNNFLVIKPREWPVDSFSALSVILADGSVTVLDPTQVVIAAGERLFTYTGPTGQFGPGVRFRRGTVGWTQISYSAGYVPLPWSIQEAARLKAMDAINRRDNPEGLSTAQGDHSHVEYRLRGDPSHDSIITGNAKELLNRYVRRD
jgi:hypothetical protein